jgi:hypothetical protein
MSRWTPCKRSEFVRRVRKLGFEGPYSGTRHQFLVSGNHRLTIPSNPEFSVPQLRLLLREVGAMIGRNLSQKEWKPWNEGGSECSFAHDADIFEIAVVLCVVETVADHKLVRDREPYIIRFHGALAALGLIQQRHDPQ